MKADDVEQLIRSFAESLDSCLDANGGDIRERIVIMKARDSLRRYSGLHDVGRCRKVIQSLPDELAAVGFPAELLIAVRRSCQRVVVVLKRV
ncbi:MAG: hypothetical protein ACK526_14010 [Planctomyces sp.]